MTPGLAEWVDRVFGRAVDVGKESVASLALAKLIEVFQNSADLLGPHPDEVLGHAFWDLLGRKAIMCVVYDESIDFDLRCGLIRSTEAVFRDLFAARCSPSLSHGEKEELPLNSVCYMWWDLCRDFHESQLPIDSVFVSSMRSILAIDHIACQESALHGLGHWQKTNRAEVENVIDEFLERQPNLPQALHDYATSARAGLVQ